MVLMYQASKNGVCELLRKKKKASPDAQMHNFFVTVSQLPSGFPKGPVLKKGIRTIDLKKITLSIKSRLVHMQDQALGTQVSISLTNNSKLIVLVRMRAKENIMP